MVLLAMQNLDVSRGLRSCVLMAYKDEWQLHIDEDDSVSGLLETLIEFF